MRRRRRIRQRREPVLHARRQRLAVRPLPGLPAPRDDERVVLWLQNSHATPIPAGAVALDRMGAEHPVALREPVGPFATVALDVATFLPDLRWPAQIELRAGRHVVRPRYEVTRAGRTRIAT